MNLVLFHGTSASCAKKIEKGGFVPDKKYNWKVKSKTGFVYLSYAYAPFYAMVHNNRNLALIKCEVKTSNLYPEDDALMAMLGKPKYAQEEFDAINLEDYRQYWKKSLELIGNVAAKPEKIKILGVRYFDGKDLLMKCDPVICRHNFMIMGKYYFDLSNHIFDGKPIMEFPSFEVY